ncbi:hypothetical protein ACFQHV_00325 [Promicromonospora thailandica]|uniref:Uncharacterized protein n=1 Tax=Promicromonospora thailandica TaxID=765201 RepID=A0A9X2JSS5_9MICO|nr:hypothetical protein [Promicromonospora thailandica]MCP2262815.1 hypothetical protein [Promicromonospora thailandica]BFF18147.1 hypothetical protein GCM10025730_16680 [Promicromonospora thailandica]
MTTSSTAPVAAGTDIPADLLFRVPRGRVLHGRGCRRLSADHQAALLPATELDRQKFTVCKECLVSLAGPGRGDFDSFDAALEALPVPAAHRPAMRVIAEGLDTTRVWIPSSRSYVAVSAGPGHEASAYFNKGFVDVQQPDGGYERVLMAGFSGKQTSSFAHAPDAAPASCPSCYMQLPATGRCDCD